MAKKTKKLTAEEQEQQELAYALERLRERLHLIPAPTRKFEVGQKVRNGMLDNPVIEEILEDGRILMVAHQKEEKEGGGIAKAYIPWIDVVYKAKAEIPFRQKQDMNIQFSQRTINDILTKAYHFGIDFDPDYQRDYVWSQKNKDELIESIFTNVDIGKFVFIKFSDQKAAELDYRYMYEILDGKQRTRALLDFYEGRFPCKGFYFHELTAQDRYHFEDYSINVAETRELTEEQTLRYFLKLNTGGKQMSRSHLEKIRQRLNELSKQN